ncbi:hypothetical protein JZ751_026280, partial [Albula glossodonta]
AAVIAEQPRPSCLCTTSFGLSAYATRHNEATRLSSRQLRSALQESISKAGFGSGDRMLKGSWRESKHDGNCSISNDSSIP